MHWLWQSIYHAAAMLWETLWALVLGFSLSAFLQVFLRNEEITKRFGQTNLRSVGLATFFEAVSSSCSYAAAAALFQGRAGRRRQGHRQAGRQYYLNPLRIPRSKILPFCIVMSECFFGVASVAQLVEQLTLNQLVHGSSPCRGTTLIFDF